MMHQPVTTAATRAVIFDMDGVLVDSTEVMRQAFHVAYAEVVGHGDPPFTEYQRHLGRYFPDIMRIMNLPLAMEGPFVRESYRLAHQVPVFPGVPQLLSALCRNGVRLAVATGKSGVRARSLLDQRDILSMFDFVIGGDEVARAKPAPDMVLRALDRLDLPAAQVAMVGDAVTDLASAHGAGVRAVAAVWGPGDETELRAAGADLVAYTPADILSWCPPVPDPVRAPLAGEIVQN